MRPLRIVQWATGNIGTRALRGVIEHPGMTLAGVYVHSPDKVGADAGELCGLGATGVAATGDPAAIVELGADCVLYMPRLGDAGEVCRLLESGANVVTTRGDYHHPATMDAEVREKVEDACARGGASLHSTGVSPGWITEAVPLVLTSVQRRLDQVTVDEFADLSRRDSPGLLFDVMGFGRPPADYDERRLVHVRESFGPSLRAVADALSVPLDAVEAAGETATSPRFVEIAAGTLEPGTVTAQRVTVTGLRGGRRVLRFRATWYCATDLDADWELRGSGWRITVDGDAPLDLDVRFPFPLERMSEFTPSYTANRALNAVPYVCAAPPGILTTADLPQVIADLGAERK
ncbi:dihydrodipicolinate reductase [Actinomadura sp. 7K507]|uniref:NAD(P)H-dependent amine dehydrogenase family protein n=1 Tax=Actinomadura sp. 7K507 TaxID=2530365 RepID=UPI001050BA9E|nr:dihydrodipicolinate reductase [Actinomadura sp. 7K507]TDC97941.1 dihydrodipicolinate reductase [Actinomadura sp. 7K507]